MLYHHIFEDPVARYRKKTAWHARGSTRKRRAFPRGLRWLVGIFLGVLGFAGLYYLYEKTQLTHDGFLQPIQHEPHKVAQPKKAVVEKRRASSAKPSRYAHPTTSSNKQEAAQRFEFYQLLPGLEVPLPDPIESAPTLSRPVVTPDTIPQHSTNKKASRLKQATPTAPVYRKQAAPRYMIQAHAYRHRDGAEQLKNRLQALGFQAKTQQVEAEDGTWFRVMIGPFANEAIALAQKKRLQQQQIHGILILQR